MANLMSVLTHTAPFRNPFTTASTALYFSCCSKLFKVYRRVFIRSGPAMTFSVSDTTQNAVAPTQMCHSKNGRNAKGLLCKCSFNSLFPCKLQAEIDYQLLLELWKDDFDRIRSSKQLISTVNQKSFF